MDTDRKWIIVRIDGKIAAISTDYGKLADIARHIASKTKESPQEITATTISFDEIIKLKQNVQWDDMLLFGTTFQKKGLKGKTLCLSIDVL